MKWVGDEDIRAPPYKFYQRRKKKTHAQESLWLDDHFLVIDRADLEDQPLDLDSTKDQQLDLIQSIM